MALNNASSLKGFRRKSTAPPAMARVRSSSFARAETKNDRNTSVGARQISLQFQAVHSRHPKIKD